MSVSPTSSSGRVSGDSEVKKRRPRLFGSGSRRIAAAFRLAVLATMASVAGAQVISTADGNGADAYITSTQSGTNFGSSEEVAIKHDSGTGQLHRKGYFRFDLASAPATLSSASLEFVFSFTSVGSPCSSDFDIYGLVDGHVGESWGELSVTWANAPANGAGGTGLIGAEVTHLGTLNIPICTTALGDVLSFSSPQLTTFLQSDSNGLVTFIVTRQQANLTNQTFATKESSAWSPAVLRLSGYGVFCGCASGPCGNAGGLIGCANSTGNGANLLVLGSASTSVDDLVLSGTGLPANSFAILFMGGGQISPTVFGDGTLCVTPGPASFCRFPVQNAGGSGSIVQGPGIVAYAGTLQTACHIQPGDSRFFQGWYRDVNGPCGAGFNLTSGASVTFGL